MPSHPRHPSRARGLAACVALLALLALLAAAAAPAPAVAKRTGVTLQGDSLAIDTRPYFPRGHHARRLRVVSDSASVSRHADQGVRSLRDQRLGRVIVFALGTNDYGYAPSWYEDQLREVLSIAGRRRCVVVPTIYVRRPIGALNGVIRKLRRRYDGSRMRIASWSKLVSSEPIELADGAHPATVAGLEARARLLTKASLACARALHRSHHRRHRSHHRHGHRDRR